MNLYEIRRDLHRIPELGFAEFKTQEYLINRLSKIKNIKIITFDFTGILVEYSPSSEKSYTIFRADMDALPIKEETNCSFVSEIPGNMHACGHDIHMTVLLGLINRIVEHQIKKNFLFFFQAAEEGKGGAEKTLKTGIFDNYKINRVFALHVNSSYPVGTVSTKEGIFFANTEEFDIELTGKTSHTAFPENGKDALAAGIFFYQLMESHLNRAFSPRESVIFHIGKMTSGTVRNAVADKCLLSGTMRTLSLEVHQKLKETVKTVKDAVEIAFNIKISVNYPGFYRCVVNNGDLYTHFKDVVISSGYKFVESDITMTGEDFGFLAAKYPGLLFWLGSGNDGFNLHSSHFLPDEKCIDTGLEILYKLSIL